MNPVLLSTAYFPPVFYFSQIVQSSQVTIEKEENFHKQTYRNRCVILGANGPLSLTVPVVHDAPKINISSLNISYHSQWQLIHLRAIESAYRNSPFYEYYIDDFVPFFKRRHDTLFDFNLHILKVCLDLIGHKVVPEFTSDFEKETNKRDLRFTISPKKEITGYVFPEYHQVFMDKFGFIANLSILDLIFNVGPESLDYLRSIQNRNGQENLSIS